MRGGGGVDDPDPFDELVLDESFIAGAHKREDSADERHARARRAADAARELDERRAADRVRATKHVRRGRTKTITGIVGVLALLVVVGVFASRLRSSSSASARSVNDLLSLNNGLSSGRPHALPPASETPLGTPAPTAGTGGSHRFLHTIANGTAARYNPCRELSIVVNNRTTPVGGPQALDAALAEMTIVSGLHFKIEGSTDEKPSDDRPAFQPERYGDRWAPILVAWTDPEEIPDLAGDIAGVGGSTWIDADDVSVNASGIVFLDGPSFAEIRTEPHGFEEMEAIILHELGHLVGLDHVNDSHELMAPENTGQLDFGPGDRTGLAELGTGPCVDP